MSASGGTIYGVAAGSNEYRRAARRAARIYDLPFFPRQIRAESGFRDVVSPAGAQGPAQLMPATARSLGVDPHSVQAIYEAAKLMRRYVDQFGNPEDALRAYNAGPGHVKESRGFSETNAYVRRILGGGGGHDVSVQRQGPGALLDAAGAGNLPQGSTGLVPLLEALGQEKPQVASGSLPQPAHSAQAAFAGQVPESGGGPAPKPDIGGLLEAIRTVGGDVTHTPGVSGSGAVQSVTQFGGGRPGGGRVVVDPNADRAGAHTHRWVVDFARQVSAVAGLPIRIGTGTNHSRLTVDGNVSDHWSGNAADIPATGRRLIRLGQAALIAAGMPEREARKQTGGLYNVGGHQIIFATHLGGDHTNHLHVSARRR